MNSKFTPAVLSAAALTLALFQPVAWSQSSAQPAQPASGAGMGNKSMDMKGMDSKGMDSKGMDSKGMDSKGLDSKGMDSKGMDSKGLDMKSMMKGNNDQMASMKMTGNADVDFAMMMRVHHQGAIDMAQAELRDGKDGKMRKLATNIIAAQKKEIAQLDKFLAKNGQPAPTMGK